MWLTFILEFQRQVITSFLEIKNNQKELSRRISVLEVDRPAEIENSMLDDVRLPFCKMEEFLNFETDLRNEQSFRNLVSC